MSFSLLFRWIWINLESFNFLQNNHFLIKIHFSLQKWLFWEKRHYLSDCWSESWFWLAGWSRMIFGLRLEPSITEFGVRLTYLPQTGFFHLIYGKINPKNLGKVIKKIIFSPFEKDFFEIFFMSPNDLGHDHDLSKKCLVGL